MAETKTTTGGGQQSGGGPNDPSKATGSKAHSEADGPVLVDVPTMTPEEADKAHKAERARFDKARDSDDHMGAAEAAEEANEQLAKANKELEDATRKAGPGGIANLPVDALNNAQNQVPQEGALVTTPPQPAPPPFPEGAEEEMDISPPGLREVDVVQPGDSTDQTVHPVSRVYDPRVPL